MIELLLRVLDFILQIEKPTKYRPPPPSRIIGDKSFQPHEMKELVDFYKEANSDMRALRDWEFKVVSLYFQVSAFFFAGNMVLFASISPKIEVVRFWIGLITIIFLLTFWLRVHARIAHDNKSYGFNMGHRQYLEALWFGEEYPKPPAHVVGQATGPGYRRMQALVALAALATSGTIGVGLAYLAPPACRLLG